MRIGVSPALSCPPRCPPRRRRAVVSVLPCPRHRRRRRNRQRLGRSRLRAHDAVAPSSRRRRPRVVVSVWPRRRHRAIVPRRRLRASPQSSPLSSPLSDSILTPCRRPSSSVLASIRSPRSAILTRSSLSLHRRRHVVAAPSSRRRCRLVGSVVAFPRFRWFAGAGRMGGTAALGLRHRLPFLIPFPLHWRSGVSA